MALSPEEKALISKIQICALSLGMMLSGCLKKNASSAVSQNRIVRSSCDVDTQILRAPKLNPYASSIVDNGMEPEEKARHLNEVNMLPEDTLRVVFTNRITLKLARESITEFSEFESYKNSLPRNWNNGATFDQIAGVYVPWAQAVLLASASKRHNAHSLAIHEVSHALDAVLSYTLTNPLAKEIFESEKVSPSPDDRKQSYRFGHITEHFAMSVEEYYCNDKTKEALALRYPRAFEFVDKQLPVLIQKKLGATVQVDPETPEACTSQNIRWVYLSKDEEAPVYLSDDASIQASSVRHCQRVCLVEDPAIVRRRHIGISIDQRDNFYVDRNLLRDRSAMAGRCPR